MREEEEEEEEEESTHTPGIFSHIQTRCHRR
jgi:hypothetical protein